MQKTPVSKNYLKLCVKYCNTKYYSLKDNEIRQCLFMLLLKENEPISCLCAKLGAHTCGYQCVHTRLCSHICIGICVYLDRCFCKQNKNKLLYICPYLPPTMNGLFVSPLNNHLSWALLYHEVMINIMAHVQRVEKPYSFSKSRCID